MRYLKKIYFLLFETGQDEQKIVPKKPRSTLYISDWNFNCIKGHCTLEIACTREGTFNFWALEVTDLVESKLLLYFCRISWAQDRL